MAWYDEAVFYHIYPLGMTGAPKENSYGEPEHRLKSLLPWISHIKEIGCNAIYIGPLFESVGHGYETTDYRKLDSRLGTNEDLTEFVDKCHEENIRVILDGVFNHTGRDFFAFRDLKEKREQSAYRNWFCKVNFSGNNEYDDGFSYDNWGGYNLLVKLNQQNPEVKNYLYDSVRFWVSEFHIDGIRLDAADVLDFSFMQGLRQVANEVKPEFWLMGEVIHGDYSRWVNEGTLHSVTNYQLHKALFSGHNDHNYFEIAHTVNHLYDMGGNHLEGLKLYNFVDNHDVERIYTKLTKKAHFTPVHILLYTLPGIPSIYYGSEFAIEGKKEQWSDDSLRPQLQLSDYANAVAENTYTKLVAALGKIHKATPALSHGDYKQLLLTNRQFAFARNHEGASVIVTVNSDDASCNMTVQAMEGTYMGALSGNVVTTNNGQLSVTLEPNSGEIWIPKTILQGQVEEAAAAEVADEKTVDVCVDKPVENKTTETEIAEVVADVVEADAKTDDDEETIVSEVLDERIANTVETEEEVVADEKAVVDESAVVDKETVAEELEAPALDLNKPYEDMTIAELQAAILGKMAANGPVTDQMKRDVEVNVYKDSLLNWVRSFR